MRPVANFAALMKKSSDRFCRQPYCPTVQSTQSNKDDFSFVKREGDLFFCLKKAFPMFSFECPS